MDLRNTSISQKKRRLKKKKWICASGPFAIPIISFLPNCSNNATWHQISSTVLLLHFSPWPLTSILPSFVPSPERHSICRFSPMPTTGPSPYQIWIIHVVLVVVVDAEDRDERMFFWDLDLFSTLQHLVYWFGITHDIPHKPNTNTTVPKLRAATQWRSKWSTVSSSKLDITSLLARQCTLYKKEYFWWESHQTQPFNKRKPLSEAPYPPNAPPQQLAMPFSL